MQAAMKKSSKSDPAHTGSGSTGRQGPHAVLRHGLGEILILGGAFLFLATPLAAQQRVTGTVKAADTGNPLAGAQVSVKGTSIGTLTAGDGAYQITAPSPQDTLVFTFIGYQRQEVPINGRSVVDVTMPQQVLALQQIVVVGYGTQRKRDVTGAVSTVQGNTLQQTPTPSVSQTLQGKVAGVQVTPASGAPGSQAIIRIRGTGTLNNASPLYVVDGMMTDNIDYLNPEDVASVEVLKDASATAIYGSRGANGVIIITTKKGTPSRTTQWSARAYVGTQSVLHQISLANAREYATLANELAANTGVPPYFANPSSVTGGTNWQDAVFQSAPIQNYELTASGGSDRVTYYFSGNFQDQQGVIPRSGYGRTTLRLNNDYQLSPHIELGHNIAFTNTQSHDPPNVVSMLYHADPTVSVYDTSGVFANANIRSSAGNPVAAIHYTDNTRNTNRLVGTLYADATFLTHFDFRSNFGLDYDRSDFRNFLPVYTVSPTQQNQTSRINVEMGNTHSWLWENTLTYNYSTEQNHLKLLGGITAQSYFTDLLGGARTDVVGSTKNLWYLNAGAATGQTNSESASNWKMLSYLFRANYTYHDKYMFTGSMRIDGSSRFGANNRYGYFPSLALGWDLAQEPFMQNMKSISAFKLRASWGQTGNDKIGAYPSVATIAGNLNAVFGEPQALQYGAAPIDLANPDVKWERTTQTDVGLDMAFLQGRIEATVDYYDRLTDGILVQVPIPLYVGANSNPTVNAAKVANSGFEASLNWTQEIGNVKVQIGANASTVKNRVKALGQGQDQILGGGLPNEVAFTTRTVPGHPVGEFWGYKVIGVIQDSAELGSVPILAGEQPGDLRFADINGDSVITDADKTFLGSSIPSLIYGFNIGATWKAFDLSANFAGQAGNKIFNAKKGIRFGVDNFETSYLNAWTASQHSNTEPRVTNAGANYKSSSRFIESGAYLMLQSAQLGYRLPESLTSKMGVQTARLYVAGQNLFQSTPYSGYSPLITSSNVIANGIDLGTYPTARTVTVGLNVTF
jgi:TonB-linked SusC/RagA family outer membrane protein